MQEAAETIKIFKKLLKKTYNYNYNYRPKSEASANIYIQNLQKSTVDIKYQNWEKFIVNKVVLYTIKMYIEHLQT